MSNLAVFSFNSQEIRFVDGKPVANDVAMVLGYADPAKTVSTKVKGKNKGVAKISTKSGIQSVTVLEEAGIYQLILSSKLPSAEKFQDWVFDNLRKLNSVPYGDLRTSKNVSGFVYLAQASQTRWCKIGMSKQPYKRMSSLQTGTPLEITLIHRVFTFDMVALEKSLHDYYAAYSLRGEWFDLPAECIREFPAIANQLDTLRRVFSPWGMV